FAFRDVHGTTSDVSRIAALPAVGQLPDMVLRSWTAPSREIGTIASCRGMSAASSLPKSRNAASTAAMHSGMDRSGSISSLLRRITRRPLVADATDVYRGQRKWQRAEPILLASVQPMVSSDKNSS